MTAFEVNTTDSQFQVDKAFPPDKESLWKFPKEHDGWFHAHNAIRGQMLDFEDCLKAIQSRASSEHDVDGVQEWEVNLLKQVFDSIYKFVHEHHTNEDDLVTPVLKHRINLPPKLEDDHVGLVEAFDSIKKKIFALKPGDNRAESITMILTEWKPFVVAMKTHLVEEEVIGLPLMRAYFTPQEIAKVTDEIIKRESKLSMGCFIHYIGKDRLRKEFMKDHGIPFFVWYIVFSGAFHLYEKEVTAAVTALKSGTPPHSSKAGWFFGC